MTDILPGRLPQVLTATRILSDVKAVTVVANRKKDGYYGCFRIFSPALEIVYNFQAVPARELKQTMLAFGFTFYVKNREKPPEKALKRKYGL